MTQVWPTIFGRASSCSINYHKSMHSLSLRLTILAILVGPWCIAFSATAVESRARPFPATGAPISQSTEAPQVPAKNAQEWYNRGIWPLAGAVAALIVTNAVAVGVVNLSGPC